jgi:anti-sigma factor RsiW
MSESQTPEGSEHGLQEQLVSYLDGELEAGEARRIEEALAGDPHVRQELQQLERSWHLLDELPRTQVDESFTRTTVEMIAVQAEQELAVVQAELPRRQRRAWLLAAGLVLVAAAAGFVTIGVFSHRSDEQLLTDLPVVEHLDQYREAGDIDFLRTLKARGFTEAEAKHER